MFVIISDTDDSLNFLVSIMYTQLFNLLCTIADDEYHGKLPVHVRCILDEFTNIGQIPKFDKLIATIRSREISASIILQSKAQFYDTYHKNMEKMAEEYGKTSVQKKYLEKKYNEIKLPVEYESYSSWDTMIMYVETYSIILAIIVGFICAGIFADDFQTKADAVFFSTKYGRTKAVKTKILAGIATTVMIYCMGIILLSVICFGIMGTSGMNTLYQMYQAYSIYIMSYGQYYLLTVVCGFIASMLAASVSMLVAAKMHTISVAVCIPFFLYCLLPFIGRALSGYTTLFNLIPTILTNVQASVKVPLIYQIGNCVFRQIPLVMVMYTVMAIALLPFIYKSFRRYGNK